jgi:tight adherence protein C
MQGVRHVDRRPAHFAAVMLAAGPVLLGHPTVAEQRLQALAPTAGHSNWTETAVKLVGPFAHLSSPTAGMMPRLCACAF